MDLAEGAAAAGLDPDDSWHTGAPRGNAVPLADGSRLEWRAEPLAAGREATLAFAVRAPDGTPAVLEPYLGMPGHAVVTRADGSVFVHLHPMGTISATAQQLFEQRARGDTSRDASGALVLRPSTAAHAPHAAGEVSFPYAFPQPGRYRVWVQVKRAGRILTGSFDLDVS